LLSFVAEHFAAAAKCEAGDRRPISVQIDRYDLGQHREGVGRSRLGPRFPVISLIRRFNPLLRRIISLFCG
jgi:hypothetical protein